MRSSLVFRVFKDDQIFVIKQFSGEDRVIIGRSDTAHIVLLELSALHCVIEKRGEEHYLCDLGSESGTFKEGRQILDEVISNGQTFEVGGYSIVFFVGVQKSIVTPLHKQTAISSDLSKVQKKRKTESTYSNLKDQLRAGQGPIVEVLVSWRDRIIETYHFSPGNLEFVQTGKDLALPDGIVPKNWKFLNFKNGVNVSITADMKIEVFKDGGFFSIDDNHYSLVQDEICYIQLANEISLVIRFAPRAPTIVFDSPLMLGSPELTGLLGALIIALLTSLLVSVYKPKPVKDDMAKERLADIVFTSYEPLQKIAIDDAKALASPKPIEVKVQAKSASIIETKSPQTKTQSPAEQGRATEIMPKESQQKIKMFTSVKQGGAVKTSPNSGTNAKSKDVDLKNSGLLAAFGTGGARAKLDKAYSGSGQLIGDSEKATGNSGFKNDRQGEDLGLKIKDTGAGGSGTATQGIAGVNTKGRAGGQGLYGGGEGFGEKGDVQISAGGGGESFAGSIDKEAVRRVVRSALPQFKSCYEREYRKNTKLSGKVVVRWDIDEKGIANNARIIKDESTINNTLVEECVRLRMLGLKFPETPVGTYAEISYPFLFDGPKY